MSSPVLCNDFTERVQLWSIRLLTAAELTEEKCAQRNKNVWHTIADALFFFLTRYPTNPVSCGARTISKGNTHSTGFILFQSCYTP